MRKAHGTDWPHSIRGVPARLKYDIVLRFAAVWAMMASHGPTTPTPTCSDASMSETSITCPHDLDIQHVGGLHSDLCAALDAGRPVVLRAAAVERVDATGVQLLAALFASARKGGIAVRWDGASQPLQEAVRLLGLQEAMGL